MALTEPLADASNVELVFARLARHLRQTLVVLMDYAIADVAVFNSLDFSFNVCFPCKNS